MHPKRGFSITPADLSAAAKSFGLAADVLAALAERVLVEVEEYGVHRRHGDAHDGPAYADEASQAASLATECVRRLRELESNARNAAVAYQRTEDAVAGRLR